MNIGIVTQPLLNNYGGLLQNFALQKVLQSGKNEVYTIDVVYQVGYFRILLSAIKTMVYGFLGKKHNTIKRVDRFNQFKQFVEKQIKKTDTQRTFRKEIFLQKKLDVVVVGSDQVWRPKYNYRIEDMYLKFAKDLPIKRIAYAASFGVDNWEYTSRQTHECSRLAKKFDAISVREESGVKLCKEHLGVDAVWVLDPTLLLAKEDYLTICEDVPVGAEKYLAVYVLDENEEVKRTYEEIAKARGLIVKKFHADSKSTLSVPEWLAMFRDASYVVTDSFHGTVFSIIFGKDFKCIYNKSRGAARFESLLNLYNSGKIEMMRAFSLNWLKNALET